MSLLQRSQRPLPQRQGFTLVELLIVLAVIVGLGGISLWIGPKIVADSEARSTLLTVQALRTAIESDGRSAFDCYDPRLQASVLLPAWDINRDGILDGRPPLERYRERVLRGGERFDPLLAAPHPDPLRSAGEREFVEQDLIHAHRLDYRGPLHDLGSLVLPDARVDQHGRILDAWRQPLRILHRGASQAPPGAASGRHFIGIYSIGRDGVDQEGAGDDIASW